MKNIPLIELYRIKGRLIKEGMEDEPLMEDVLNAINEKEKSILEDTSDIELHINFTYLKKYKNYDIDR
jgi:hypothetical protein